MNSIENGSFGMAENIEQEADRLWRDYMDDKEIAGFEGDFNSWFFHDNAHGYYKRRGRPSGKQNPVSDLHTEQVLGVVGQKHNLMKDLTDTMISRMRERLHRGTPKVTPK